jgi:hypothetical protein
MYIEAKSGGGKISVLQRTLIEATRRKQRKGTMNEKKKKDKKKEKK